MTDAERAFVATHELYGLRNARLTPLQQLVNTSFRVEAEQGQFLLRLHRKSAQTESRIQSELSWLSALANDTELKVQRPQQSTNGRLVVRVDGTFITLLSWLNGKALPQAERSAAHYRSLGRMTATLHRHAQQWTPENLDRPRLGSEQLIAADGWHGLSADAAVRLKDLCTRLRKVELQLGTGRDVYGLIHSDLSFGNVLFDDREAMPIDFDDCGFGHYLYDLAVIFAGAWSQPDYPQRRDAVLAGYREVRPLGDELLARACVDGRSRRDAGPLGVRASAQRSCPLRRAT